jgi:hypothetical protein
MSEAKKPKIDDLTEEQKAKIPEYLQRFLDIGMSTAPTDRKKAEEAVRRSYKYLNKKDPNLCVASPEFVWAESPITGAVLAAQFAKGSTDVTEKEIKDQADHVSYGSFDAYWVSTYSFIANELPVEKDELCEISEEIVKECGVYWTFHDLVVLTPKPTSIVMEDKVLHNTEGPALSYPDGNCLYAYKGSIKGSLMEVAMTSKNKE